MKRPGLNRNHERDTLIAALTLFVLAGLYARYAIRQNLTPVSTPSPSASASAVDPARDQRYRGLTPYEDVQAPVLTRAVAYRMTTDAGTVDLEVYPQAAPNAAARWEALVRTDFYDNTPVSRVVPHFVAQFGINWRAGKADWKERTFKDDPGYFDMTPGTVCFANAGPDTNSTQIFINLEKNTFLRSHKYAVFGRVTAGMEVVNQFKVAGEPNSGLDQDKLWTAGESYLKGLPEPPTVILKIERTP